MDYFWITFDHFCGQPTIKSPNQNPWYTENHIQEEVLRFSMRSSLAFLPSIFSKRYLRKIVARYERKVHSRVFKRYQMFILKMIFYLFKKMNTRFYVKNYDLESISSTFTRTFFLQNFGAKNYKAVFWVWNFGAKDFVWKMSA